DAPQRSLRKSVALETRPRVPAVRRLPDAAARTAAVHAARGAAALVGRGIEHLAVPGVDHQIVGAGIVVDLQRLLPGLAAVGRLEDAPLAAGTEERSGGGDPDDVVVARV